MIFFFLTVFLFYQKFCFREEVKNCKERIQNLEKKRNETYGEIEKAQENENMYEILFFM